ncbi:MAG: metallophosphoesterase family protein [Promethearchaeota archaeon]
MQPIKFIHFADTHLGNVQYKIFERFRDFNRSFNSILNKALQLKVDFVIHAGDFFNSNKINPETLSAIHIMITAFNDKCKAQIGRFIPIIVIEGNHDKKNYFAKRSWLKFLADLNLIKLLTLDTNNNSEKGFFRPYSEKTHRGNMIQIKGCNIYGIQYFGAVTEHLFPKIYNALPKGEETYNILLMHFGITGQVKGKLGFELSDVLQKLHEKIDYLALGHYHKSFQLPPDKPWIYNPGSTEINAPKELYGDEGNPFTRGIYYVEINGKKTHEQNIRLLEFENGDSSSPNTLPNRSFYNMRINLEKPTLKSFDEVITFVVTEIGKHGFERISEDKSKDIDKKDLNLTFLFISLFGNIPLSKLEFNFSKLRETVLKSYKIFDVKIYSQGITSELDGVTAGTSKDLSIDEIETDTFTKMIEIHPNYAKYTNEIVTLMKDLKTPLLKKAKDNSVVPEIISWWENIHHLPKTNLLTREPETTLGDFVPTPSQVVKQNPEKGNILKSKANLDSSEEEEDYFKDDELNDGLEDLDF